jgi:hypothetical protein
LLSGYALAHFGVLHRVGVGPDTTPVGGITGLDKSRQLLSAMQGRTQGWGSKAMLIALGTVPNAADTQEHLLVAYP